MSPRPNSDFSEPGAGEDWNEPGPGEDWLEPEPDPVAIGVINLRLVPALARNVTLTCSQATNVALFQT